MIIPRQGAAKYIQMPCHIQAKKADEKLRAGLTLNPEMDGAEYVIDHSQQGHEDRAEARKPAVVAGKEHYAHDHRTEEKFGEEGDDGAIASWKGDDVAYGRGREVMAEELMGEEDSAEAAGELGNDVGKCVPAMDAAEPEIGEGDGGVQVGSGTAAEWRTNNEICRERDGGTHKSRFRAGREREGAQGRLGAVDAARRRGRCRA